MRKKYDSPLLEIISVKHTTNVLHSLSVHGPIENYGDGGDLGNSIDYDSGDFFNY